MASSLRGQGSAPCSLSSNGRAEAELPSHCPFGDRSARPWFGAASGYQLHRIEPYADHPPMNEPGVLPRRRLTRRVTPTAEKKLTGFRSVSLRSSGSFRPKLQSRGAFHSRASAPGDRQFLAQGLQPVIGIEGMIGVHAADGSPQAVAYSAAAFFSATLAGFFARGVWRFAFASDAADSSLLQKLNSEDSGAFSLTPPA